MLKDFLRNLAWRLLHEDIKRQYIHRSEVGTYTRWMSPYWPIMEDANDYLQSGANRIQRHREEMIEKHIAPKIKVITLNGYVAWLGTQNLTLSNSKGVCLLLFKNRDHAEKVFSCLSGFLDVGLTQKGPVAHSGPLTLLEFGTGHLIVDTGYSHNSSAVFVREAQQPGKPGESASREEHGRYDVVPNEIIFLLDSQEKAEKLADLLVGGSK